jgi:hypothetical protein
MTVSIYAIVQLDRYWYVALKEQHICTAVCIRIHILLYGCPYVSPLLLVLPYLLVRIRINYTTTSSIAYVKYG